MVGRSNCCSNFGLNQQTRRNIQNLYHIKKLSEWSSYGDFNRFTTRVITLMISTYPSDRRLLRNCSIRISKPSRIGPTIHQVEPQRVQRLWQRMGRTYTYLSCSQQQLYLVVSQQRHHQPHHPNNPLIIRPKKQRISPNSLNHVNYRLSKCLSGRVSVSNKVVCSQAHSRGCEDNGKMNELAKVTVNQINNSFMNRLNHVGTFSNFDSDVS